MMHLLAFCIVPDGTGGPGHGLCVNVYCAGETLLAVDK